jgi:DNA-binding Lrp family transcriptional regulator
MQRDARDDESHARHLHRRRDLGEHNDPDHRGRSRQQRHHQRVGGPRQPPHGQLVRDVGDHRRAQADAGAREQCDRVAERGQDLPAADRGDHHRGDQHRRSEPVDPAQRAVAGHAVGEHDVGREQQGVREGERHSERLALELHPGQEMRAFAALDREGRRLLVGWGAVLAVMNACFYHGRRHSANTTAADAIPSQATPSTSTRANSSGLSLSAIIRVRPSPGQIQYVAELARETAEVVECHRVTGDDCYVMRAHLCDVLHLEEVIDRFTVLGQTTTSIMQSSPVPGRPLDLDLDLDLS